jgi:hypothetical protein
MLVNSKSLKSFQNKRGGFLTLVASTRHHKYPLAVPITTELSDAPAAVEAAVILLPCRLYILEQYFVKSFVQFLYEGVISCEA